MDPKILVGPAERVVIDPRQDPGYREGLQRLKRLLEDKADLRQLSIQLGMSDRYLANVFSEGGTLAYHHMLKLSELTGIPLEVFVETVGPQRVYLPEEILQRERERGRKAKQESAFLNELASRIERLMTAKVAPVSPGSRSTLLDHLEDERFRNRLGAMRQTEALLGELTNEVEARAAKGSLPGPRLGELSASIALWATIQRTLGFRNLAVQAFQLSFPLARHARDSWASGTNHQRAAHVLRDLNRADLALDFISEAHWEFDSIDSSIDRWRCLVDRGAFHGRRSEFNASDNCYRAALRLLPKSEWRQRAGALQGLANNAHFQGRAAAGRKLAEQGMAECQAANSILAYLKWRYAAILFDLNRVPAAKASFREGIELMGQFGSGGELALLVLDYAEMLTKVGNFADSIELAEAAARWLPQYRSNQILHRALSDFLDLIRVGRLSLAKVIETRVRVNNAGPEPSLIVALVQPPTEMYGPNSGSSPG